MYRIIMVVIIGSLILLSSCKESVKIQQWQYVQIDSNRTKWGDYDEPEWLRYFGIDAMDINNDHYLDIVSGKYLYKNPGGNLSNSWNRIEFEHNLDAMLICNIDNDEYADIIAEALPNVYWIEAENKEGTKWNYKIITQIPATGHVNGQGYLVADVFSGGKSEILLTAEGGIFAIIIPENPGDDNWETIQIVKSHSDEGFDVIDINNDGNLDIVAGDRPGEDKPIVDVKCYLNPGKMEGNWESLLLGNSFNDIDRVKVRDLNNDGLNDIILTEERYPGLEPDANLLVFISPGKPLEEKWERKSLIKQYSMNNLDVADIDNDGDFDIVTNEHKGTEFKLQLFLNDGFGKFTEVVIDTGKECHLGTRLFDLDNDGDLDIIGHAWDEYKYLHMWRNDFIQN